MKRRKPFTGEEKQQIANLYQSGQSSTTLARAYSTTDTIILRHLKAMGIETRKQKTYSDGERQLMVDAYLSGLSTQKVGRQFGVNSATVFGFLKERGIELRLQKNTANEHEETIIELYASGKTVSEVASRLGSSKAIVGRFLNKRGLTRGPKEANKKAWQSEKVNKVRREKLAKLCARQKGSFAPAWRGGLTSLNKLLRSSATYISWRSAVFARDQYTCQHCGDKGCKIEADHIFPFSALLERHNITCREQAISCADLWHTDNGRTLCRSCHEKTDTYQNGAKKYLNR